MKLSKDILSEMVEVLCVGYPFSAFKIIFGVFSCRELSCFIGIILVIWGLLDLAINSINLASLVFKARRWRRTCLLNYLAGIFLKYSKFTHEGPKDLGTALDVLLSFVIVSVVIGGNFFGRFNVAEQSIWSLGVILNVLSAGLSRFITSSKRLKRVRG